MGMKEMLQIMALQNEVNKLRAEKFVMEQRAKEAEEFMNRISLDLERSRMATANISPAQFNHPALIAYDKRLKAFELTEYLYYIFTGGKF